MSSYQVAGFIIKFIKINFSIVVSLETQQAIEGGGGLLTGNPVFDARDSQNLAEITSKIMRTRQRKRERVPQKIASKES